MQSEEKAQKFARRLIGCRNAQGLTQSELARAAEVSLRSVQIWESGNANLPRPAHLRRLSEVLHVSIGYLFGDDASAARDAAGESPGDHRDAPAVVRDEIPSWQRDLSNRMADLPEWRLRRVLTAVHSMLDALAEAPAADPPRARYSQPPPPPPSSARDTSMEAHAALVPAHMAPRPAASPRATPTVASPSGSEHGPATPPPHSIVQ